MTEEISKQQAIELSKFEFWLNMPPQQIAEFQLFTKRLCLPFDVFHKSLEIALNRPVFTHEFGLNVEGLKNELLGNSPPPSILEIIELIPKEKHVIIFGPKKVKFK